MDRLFLRVYVNLLLAMLLAALGGRALIAPHIDERLASNIEETFAGPVAVMAEMLAEERAQHRDIRAVLERASGRLSVPVSVVSRSDVRLDVAELARLDREEVVRSGGRRPPCRKEGGSVGSAGAAAGGGAVRRRRGAVRRRCDAVRRRRGAVGRRCGDEGGQAAETARAAGSRRRLTRLSRSHGEPTRPS
jgi:hypothetical protein